jgi:outer membrane receptor for ferrienterochelin and colicins
MTHHQSPFVPRLLAAALAGALLLAAPLHAQDAPAVPPVPAATESPKPTRPTSAAVPQKVEQVEITGKNTSTDERRNSTVGKIIISRDDIEQYGDTNLGDVMRRLPGVTTGGRPGRPGAPRMRGMGGGFTQILIDGQRIAPGGAY